MADGLTRKEQWALLGLVSFILLGLGVQQWRERRNGDNDVVSIDGQGHWRKLTEVSATDPSPSSKQAVPAYSVSNSLSATSPVISDEKTTSSGLTNHPLTAHRVFSSVLDINVADVVAFESLPGIGPVRAAAIVALRARLGGFRSVEQLNEVPGIGEKTMAQLRPLITCEKMVAPAASQTRGSVTESSSSAAKNYALPKGVDYSAPEQMVSQADVKAAKRININTASAAELEKLPGIGPALARRIIEFRQLRGAFRRVEELEEVSGIGPAKLRLIRSLATVQ